MKLGKIEEAEKEKDLATLASLNKNKVDLETLKLEKQEKLKNSMKMYQDVLKIDPEDVFANFSLGEINFKLNYFKEAKKYLKRVIALDEKHSKAYLVLAKTLLKLEEFDRTSEILDRGIKIAALKGENKNLLEMQDLKELCSK